MTFWTNVFALSLSVLTLRGRWMLGSAFGWLWFEGLKLRRWTVLKNLSIAFPEKSHEERLVIARKSMAYLCYNFFEICLMPRLDEKWAQTQVVLHDFENYQRALAQKKGVLCLSLHMGNGDVGVAALALRGIQLHVISKKFKNPWLNQMWFGVRERMGTKFLEAHGPSLPFQILKACKQNQGVVFVIDQFMGKPFGIASRFFGRKTGTAYGLALFALKTGAPVIPMYTYRDEALKTHIVFLPAVPFEKIEDRDLQMSHMTQKYNDQVEKIVRLHPQQWMWVHRRWKRWE